LVEAGGSYERVVSTLNRSPESREQTWLYLRLMLEVCYAEGYMSSLILPG
jgi:hypothetical protein